MKTDLETTWQSQLLWHLETNKLIGNKKDTETIIYIIKTPL